MRKDVLIMSVMAGSRYGRQLEKRDAGMGSSSHDLKDMISKCLILLFQRQVESKRAVFR